MDRRTANRIREHTAPGHILMHVEGNPNEPAMFNGQPHIWCECSCGWFGWLLKHWE